MCPKIPKPILRDLKNVGSYTGFLPYFQLRIIRIIASNSGRKLELEDIYFKKLNRRELARAEYYVEKRKTDKFCYESKFHEQMVW